MKRVHRRRIISWNVEEHLGGFAGAGWGPGTGKYATEEDAIFVMAQALAAGNSATCIARNVDGDGVMLVLGLVK